MKRISKVLAALCVVAASTTGVALAASSPTIVTGAATSVTDTTVVLHGRVNPNGDSTTYVFNYGPTTAFGAATPAHAAGHGTAGVDVATTITGLTPGTVYYYQLTASSTAGAATGAPRAFTTTGHPPAGVVTGAAVNVRKTLATVTGSVDPEGAVTTWVVQYGLTIGYGVQTFGVSLAAVNEPLAVTQGLSGLAPATLFHYRIVAFHPGGVTSLGADQTFFTEPFTRPKPRLSAHTSPSLDKRSPYTFTTAGTLSGAGFIPAAQRCSGTVGIRYYNGRRQLAHVVAPVGGDCKFSVPASFKRLFGHGKVALGVAVDFLGNGYIAPVNVTDHVSAG
jgi:hypothetical protein